MTESTQAKVRWVVWSTDPVEQFLAYLAGKRYAKKTIRNYRLDLYKMARELGRPLYLADKAMLNAYMLKLSGSSLKASTIQRKQTSLRSFYKWALKNGIVETDPTVDFEALKKPARLPIHLEANEIDILFGVLDEDDPIGIREQAIIKTLYYTGCRAGELVGLDVSSWDQRAGYLRVVGKGDKERLIPVPAALAETLRTWLAVHPVGKGAMFTSLGPDPERICYDRVRGIFNQVIKRAGLQGKGYTAHKLRHSYATLLVNNGVSIDKIQQLLGHSQISTTTIYAHTKIDSETIAALDRIL